MHNRLGRLTWIGLIQINIVFLGLNMLSATNGLILPLLVQQIAGSEQQGDYFGQVRLWSLMTAILALAAFGALSDHSTLRWGRRRPFILTGALLTLALLWGVGQSPLFSGQGSFGMLLAAMVALQVVHNITTAGANGLIPDLVPPGQLGLASGVKAFFEAALPLILAAVFIGGLIGAGRLWPALRIALLVFALAVAISLTVKERRWERSGSPFQGSELLRLALMTAAFTLVILGLGALIRLLLSGRLAEPGAGAFLPILLGLACLAFIIGALFAGGWISMRIGLGQAALQENPSFRWWVLHRLAFLTGIMNMAVFVIYFLQSRLQMTGAQAAGPGSQLMGIMAVLITLATLPAGWLSDRWGKKKIAMASGVLAALGTLVVLLTTSLPVLIIGGCLIGLAAGLFYPSSWALGAGLVPPGSASKYLGVQNLAAAGAGAVGAYIGGPLADYYSRAFPFIPGLGYLVLYAMFGVLCLLSSVALRGVRES